MIENFMPKGWAKLIDEAVERIIKEQIEATLVQMFPEVKTSQTRSEVGFSYAMREYIQSRWTSIMKADPEIDNIIREGLLRALNEGFKSKEPKDDTAETSSDTK